MRAPRLRDPRQRRARLALTQLALLLAAVASCHRQPPPEPRLIFADDFDRAELGDQWHAASEAWRIVDGQVAGENARNDGLWLNLPLPEKVRIEFSAQSLSDEGDLKFEIFTDGRTHQTGYIGIFGGWSNTLNIIARLDEHGDDRLVGAEGKRVERGRVYQFRIERTDARLRWSVDGQPFITYTDPQPLAGDGHRHFGFNDWAAPVRFDNFRVYDLAPAP